MEVQTIWGKEKTENFLSCMFMFTFLACLSIDFSPLNRYISYLPLAHIYERANQITSAYYGVAVGFYQGVGRLT